MLQGQCLCGGVQYEVDGAGLLMVNCHCTRCQRKSGAAHGTVIQVKPEDYRITKGDDLVHRYEEDGFTTRVPCRTCGGGLYHGETFIEAGTLTADPGMRPSAHIMVAYKAPWHTITDDLPQHDEFPG